MFEFASKPKKVSAGIASVIALGIIVFFLTPYKAPPTGEIAVVIGNTQNTPAPSISGNISEAIADAMLFHKGEDADTLMESIKFISAVKQPDVIKMRSSDVKIRKISNNNSNAKRDIRLNLEALEEKINGIKPADNGANYLEAIIEASENIKKGSTIIVIGSGLSDSGDLNFSKTNILTNEEARDTQIEEIQEKYGHDRLEGYTIEFFGLGDTAAPQEELSSIQKGIVRDIYKDTVRKLGGESVITTRTQTGNPIETIYVVGTTDTGCGDINLIFDDEDLKFVGDMAIFIDSASASKSLSTISDIWSKQKDTIELIQVDGYTAHYPGAGQLSQDRADTVKKTLVGLGVDANKITATGKGYGPYETDAQNRTVKVNISRDNKQCAN